jgi:uncharacterized protein YlxW (UPF0749 family)
MPESKPSTPGPRPDGGQDDQDGRDRLFHSLFKPTRRQIIVGLLLALLGFAGVTQVRANEVDDDYSGAREQDLIDVLDGLAGARQRAEAELADLQEVRDGLESETSGTQAAIAQLTDEVDTLSILAGLVPVTGSGIRITITEETGQVKLSSMLDVLQELRTVGAEAIQFNGQVRVVAQTSFEDAAGGFLVDGELMESPYVIDVIGEPNVLEGAMEFIDGPKWKIEGDGGTLVVDELSSLDIEAVRRPVQPEYAEPDPGQ